MEAKQTGSMSLYVITALHKFTGNRVIFSMPDSKHGAERVLDDYLKSRAHKKQKRYSCFKIEEHHPKL